MNLTRMIKRNRIMTSAAYRLRAFLLSLKTRKYRTLPIENNTVLFNSFNGNGFSDNPKAIARKLHEMDHGLRMYWVCRDLSAEKTLPDYMIPLRYGSDQFHRVMSTAKVWVFNVCVPQGIFKKEGQVYIQSWHGDRGFKKVLLDAHKYGAGYVQMESLPGYCDLAVAGSGFMEKEYRSAFGYKGTILAYGTPRDDILVENSPEGKHEIRGQLGISAETRLLLYAPTFRLKGADDTQLKEREIQRILDCLEDRFRCEWKCLVRAHPSGGQIQMIEDNERIIDGSDYTDMADLLLASDLLITDYSSSAGDFVLMNRPVILYQPDIRDYEQKERNFYFEMDQSPFYIAHNTDELEQMIRKLDPEDVKENCDEILRFYNTHESGEASQMVSEYILSKIR